MTPDPIALDLLGRIDANLKGRYTIKVRTLMEKFGFTATYRLRQSSLAEVVRQLEEWGIDHRLPANASSGDYISLLRAGPMDTPVQAPGVVVVRDAVGPSVLEATPLPDFIGWLFGAVDILGHERSASVCQDMVLAVWAHRPVVVLAGGCDEHFGLLAGVLAAHMRRRRSTQPDRASPLAPTMMSWRTLNSVLHGTEIGFAFPEPGAVYLVRDDGDDSRDDGVVASIREMLVPHTYRLTSRFASTRGEAQPRAREDSSFSVALEWLALFAGAPDLAHDLAHSEFLDLASAFASGARSADEAVLHAAHGAVPKGFRAGFESREHITAKIVMHDYLSRAFPNEPLQVEATIDGTPDGDEKLDGNGRRARPDLQCGNKVIVEFETLRGLGDRGADPILALQRKLADKARHLSTVEQVWVLFPTDVALLLLHPLAAMVDHLQQTAPSAQWRMGCIDWQRRRPVLFKVAPPARPTMHIEAASWRPSRKPSAATRVTWKDVAGYDSLREQLEKKVLYPLRHPEFFAQHGLAAPNGVLLYGLPGCGKSLIGRVLAGELDVPCRFISPSDLTSKWIGEGTERIRAMFDDALRLPACLFVIDEIDAIAPPRSTEQMHQDERRQVNELLVQLDRIAGKPVTVVATTNYLSGVDTAIRRSGRFDVKIPVFPPDVTARAEVFKHYLDRHAARIMGADGINVEELARATPLFTPADIATVVRGAATAAVYRAATAGDASVPYLDQAELVVCLAQHQRSISKVMVTEWVAEVRSELGHGYAGLAELEADCVLAFGR